MFPSNRFKNKRLLVGITGGIAAYKITELVRFLVTEGAQVQVVMTAAAEQFITRTTMETLSQHPVASEMFPQNRFAGTHHIHLADQMDAAIIAPATYNMIGKIHAGVADDLLTTIVAALQCPVVLAPAMNVHMWENPILQRNLNELRQLGYLICEPEEGFLAEGYHGKGRLARLEYLLQYLYKALHPQRDSLKGKKVLVTAGRTEEPLDPVRMLTNRSSGKMGYALAWEAFARGADVTLVHGPTDLPAPMEVNDIPVNTAEEMFQAVREQFSDSDIYLSAAAIADFTPQAVSDKKIKKREGEFHLPLKRTTDVLQYVGENKRSDQVLVGFAVETDQTLENARKKLERKNLDMVVLNNPLEAGSGFRQDTNKATLIHRNGEIKELALMPKLDVAYEIFEFLKQHLKSKH